MTGHEIICDRKEVGGCGFRVGDRYFETKKRFAAGICPNCGGPVKVVHERTDSKVTRATIDENGVVVIAEAPKTKTAA